MTKRCPECERVLSLEDFHVDRTRRMGRTRLCRACDNERSRRYYEANRQRVLARTAGKPRTTRTCLRCDEPATSQRHWFCDTCRMNGARRSRRPSTPAPPPLNCAKCSPAPSCRVDADKATVERWIASYLHWSRGVAACDHR